MQAVTQLHQNRTFMTPRTRLPYEIRQFHWMSTHGRPQKWKCTTECKLPTDDEVRSILKAKDFFKLPMAELRRELENVDNGCENGHYTTACSVGPGTFPSGEDGPCSPLLGHPLACASGNCHSLLRMASCMYVSPAILCSTVTSFRLVFSMG